MPPEPEPNAGTLALVGSGEFLPGMREVDRILLRRAGGTQVAVLPTAAAPDGVEVAERWGAAGVTHFEKLGATATAVMALDRAGCHEPASVEAIRRSNLVYLSGGKPDYLYRTLAATPLWEALTQVLARGGVVAGCSAGAMILGGWIPARPSLRHPSLWQPAFGLVPSAFILPHFDEMPRWILGPLSALRPRRSVLIGIDGDTALVGARGRWEVLGRARVVVRGEPPAGLLPSGTHRANHSLAAT